MMSTGSTSSSDESELEDKGFDAAMCAIFYYAQLSNKSYLIG